MSELIPFIRPVLIAVALFLSVAAYAQAFQAPGQLPAAPDRPLPPPLPRKRVEADIAYI